MFKTRHCLCCVTFGIAIALTMLTAPIVRAQGPQLTLTVLPTSISLAPGETEQILVVATSSITSVQAITLTAFAEPAVGVTIADAQRTSAPLGQDVAWNVVVTRAPNGRSTGKIFFRADYVFQDAEQHCRAGVLTTSLDVQERAPTPIDQIMTATIETSLESSGIAIEDRRSRPVYVVVRNISPVPITITQVTAWPITFFSLLPEVLDNGYRLEPQMTHPFSLTLQAGDRVEPGMKLMVIQVNANWERAGLLSTGSLVLTRTFQVGVFGESEILAVTAIPSLLFLPGFLFVTAGLLLLKWSWKKTPFEFDLKKPEFWFLAVTFSFLAVLIYPYLTGPVLSALFNRPFTSRDYLLGYGFTDILYLWLGTTLIALLLWAVFSAVFLSINAVKARQDRERRAALTPKEGDLPLDILRKIVNNNAQLNLPARQYQDGNRVQRVYLLPNGYPEAGYELVVPRVYVLWRHNNDYNAMAAYDEAYQTNNARRLIHLVQRWGFDDPPGTLDWFADENDPVKHVLRVPQQSLHDAGEGDGFLAPP